MNKLYLVLGALMLNACAPQDESQGAPAGHVEPTAVSLPVSTLDIEASKGFDFLIDRPVELMLDIQGKGRGGVQVYRRLLDTSVPGQRIPDPTSMLASVNTAGSVSLPLMVNDNWTSLVVAWIPQSSRSNNEVHVLELVPGQAIYHLSL